MALRRPLALPAVLLLIVVAGGCGGDGGLLSATGLGSEPNSADAEFARDMAANDRQVAALVTLAPKRASRKELRKIAKSTLARLGLEQPRLADTAADLASAGVRPKRPPRPAIPGVDARKLRGAVSFDHEFMVMMIRAHEAAVVAAEAGRDRGGDGRVRALAREILEWRTQDLEQLRRWLHTWYGEDTLPGEGAPDPSGPGGSEDPQV